MELWFNIGDVITAKRGQIKYYGRVLRCRVDQRLDCNIWDPITKKFAIKAFAKEEIQLATEVEKEILRQRSVMFNREVKPKPIGVFFVKREL